MRIVFFGILAGAILAGLSGGPPVSAQTCSNVVNAHSSQTECCGCSQYDLTSTDRFTNNNSEAVTACLIVVAVENIDTSINPHFITAQCEVLPAGPNQQGGNRSVGVTRQDNCLQAEYDTLVQITGQSACNSHDHEFAEEGLCCE